MKFSAIVGDWTNPWRAYLAEFLGTFVVVFVTSTAVLSAIFYGELDIGGVAIASGLAYAVMVFATVHLSGGHLNPAVTLGMWLAQKFSGSLAFFYISAQILGGILASVLVFYVFGTRSLDFVLGGPILSSDISLATALSYEAIFSAILVFVYFATMVDRRGPTSFGPMVVGFVMIFATMILLPMTGASLNPARAIGASAFSQVNDGLIVSVAGPMVGSLVGIVYDFVFLRKKK